MRAAGKSEVAKICPARMPKVVGRLEIDSPPLLTAASRANWLIRRGEAIAERVIEEAESQGKSIRQKHLEEGHRHGRMDAIYGISAIQSLYSNLLSTLVEDLVKVVEVVSREILSENLDLASEVLSGKIISVVAQLRKKSTACVRVNPADYHQLEQLVKDSHPSSILLNIAADSSLARGSFIVETSFGSIDGSIEQHLVALTTALRLPCGALENYARSLLSALFVDASICVSCGGGATAEQIA